MALCGERTGEEVGRESTDDVKMDEWWTEYGMIRGARRVREIAKKVKEGR